MENKRQLGSADLQITPIIFGGNVFDGPLIRSHRLLS